MNDNLGYLAAAYLSVWVVLAVYIFVLLKRNGALVSQVESLEERIDELEKKLED